MSKSIVSIKDLSKEEIEKILSLARIMEYSKEKHSFLSHKNICLLFSEPSTRTRLSFAAAAHNLGANVLYYESFVGTSEEKGESFYDSMHTIQSYADLLVLRTKIEGAPRYVTDILPHLAVINAGDGANQHPSQALLDLYTIQKRFSDLSKIKIGFIGDLKYSRTIHSLIDIIRKWGAQHMYFVADSNLQIPQETLEILESQNIRTSLHEDFHEILEEIDFLYVTRIQKERFLDPLEYLRVKYSYELQLEDLQNKVLKPHFGILHPFPRVDEIRRNIDSTPYNLYFEQMKNGVYIREAMLTYLLRPDMVMSS